jgi:hypothetical protein
VARGSSLRVDLRGLLLLAPWRGWTISWRAKSSAGRDLMAAISSSLVKVVEIVTTVCPPFHEQIFSKMLHLCETIGRGGAI